jgi:hypothetical protein
MKTSLSVLSKKYLEKKGYTVEKTEHFNFFAKKRFDLLGVGDLIALNGKENLLVQTTSRDHLSERRKKANESEKLKLWLSAGGSFILHGWDKYKNRWRVKELSLGGD